MTEYEKYAAFFMSKEQREPFRIRSGRGCVMLSAPHSVEQTRLGKLKYGEYQTGILANLLHDALDCPIICKTCNCGDDANYDEFSDYKTALVQYISTHGIRYLLDLHQLASRRVEDLNIGTAFGANLMGFAELPALVKEHFQTGNVRVITLDTPFDASYPFTVSSYTARECKIPCLQLEINSRLLYDEYEDCCFSAIMTALEKIVRALNGW